MRLKFSLEEKLQIIESVTRRAGAGEKVKDIIKDFGITADSFYGWKKRLKVNGVIEMPIFPEDDIDIEDIIKQRKEEYRQKHLVHNFLKWYPVIVNTTEPIAIAFVGDPHIDNDGCNWPQLEADIKVLKETDYMYAVGIGDYTDNWVGRLERLYSQSNMSKSRALKLLEWFVLDSGISWLSLVAGNHDQWSGDDSPLKLLCKQNNILILDSVNQFKLNFNNGRTCRIDARHDFKGHSMWNSLHGMQKAAHMKEPAHIYVAGHTHNWAIHQEESASKDFVYWLLRSRGYKHIDHYATELGHDEQEYGSSICVVIDPRVSERNPEFIQAFASVKKAADYLKYLRGT